MYRNLLFIAVVAIFAACAKPQADNQAGTNAVKAILVEQQKTLDMKNADFFLPPLQRLQMRKKLRFAPIAQADTFAVFDTAVWRAALIEQYQIRTNALQSMQYFHCPIQGSYEDSLHILNIKLDQNTKKPVSMQLIWDKKGQLIHESDAQMFSLFVLDSLNNAPFILLLDPDTRPNHHLLAYSSFSHTLIDKIDNYSDNLPATYSQPQLDVTYTPNELTMQVADFNGDKLSDLLFSGTQILKNGKKTPILLYFLYRKSKDAFMYVPDFNPADIIEQLAVMPEN
jgi:hypothetical protein